MILEAIAVKVALIVKGIAVAGAHQGVSVAIAQQFTNMVGAAGLVAALHWLIGSLISVGVAAGFIETLQKLVKAVEEGKPLPALEAAANAVARAAKH